MDLQVAEQTDHLSYLRTGDRQNIQIGPEAQTRFIIDETLFMEGGDVNSLRQRINESLITESGFLLPRQVHLRAAWAAAVADALRSKETRICLISDLQDSRSYAIIRPVSDNQVAVDLEPERLCPDALIEDFAELHGLTPTERSVLRQLAFGSEPKQIASLNSISISTVRTHIKNILWKVREPGIRSVLVRLGRLAQLAA